MCGTTYSSLQSSNTLNYRHVITHGELASLYTVPLSAVNGFSRLTKLTTSKEQARSTRFKHFVIGQSLWNQIGWRFKFKSNLEALQVPRVIACRCGFCIHRLNWVNSCSAEKSTVKPNFGMQKVAKLIFLYPLSSALQPWISWGTLYPQLVW